jgi:Ca2+-transporting ATPase
VGLLVNEAPLTGESEPQAKDAGAQVDGDAPLAERPTAVHAGTTVVDGEGRALVVAVGSQTELGRVALRSAAAEDKRTPLQEQMDDLARTLAFVAVGVSLLIPLAGLLRGFDFQQMVLTWLSLTFLMVPGQPPIIITMALALAAFDLAQRDVIVRRLTGAETLGSIDTLLSDKTGTITENEIALAAVVLGDGTVVRAGRSDAWRAFLRRALPGVPRHSNDPTDEAIHDAAAALDSPVEAEPGKLVDEVGFARGDATRRMTYRRDGEQQVYLTGSPEAVADEVNRWADDEETHPWTRDQRQAMWERVDEMAAQGRRVTAYAWQAEDGMTLAGLAVLEDPIREGVGEAIEALRQAGVRTAMVTGDRPVTARCVAQEIGLDAGSLVTGPELEEADLEDVARTVDVFARTSPEQKLDLVQALQSQGETVAVTGDGINDGPALRAAHLGIAMGTQGTDVAREAADLILTDDNLGRLPEGVAIGRRAYDNFSKGLIYYLSAKAILLAIFIVPLLVGVPFPFAPIQVIVTELLMDLASSTVFVTEEAELDVLRRGPRRRARFLSWAVGRRILRNSVGLVVAILGVYFGSLALGEAVESARTAAWATWLVGHIVLALNLKQERMPLLQQGLLSNRFGAAWLVGMVILVIVMTLVPAARQILNTTRLRGVQWAMVGAGAVLASFWLEVRKWVRREGHG